MFERKPTNWMQKPLSDLGKYTNGFAFKPDDWKPQGLPIVRIAQITGSSSECDYYQGVLSDVFKIDNGDLIFSWSGTLKVVEWTGGPAWLNQHLFKVMPSSEVHPRFLYHTLVTSVEEMKKRAHGSTMKHIKRNELKNHLVCLPSSLDEQKTIATILDTLDTQIRQTDAIIAKLQQVKQGLLQDLLTRGIDENGQLRPPYEQAPQLYKESPLGWIPKEWEVSSVGEEFNIDSGITLGSQRIPRNNPYPYLRVANVHRDDLFLDDIKKLEASNVEVLSKGTSVGDLLVVEGHASTKEIGRCAMVNELAAGMLFQNHLFRLRSKRLENAFGLLWMNSSYSQKYWRCEAATSSGLNTINRTKLNALKVSVPENEEQERIVDNVLRFKVRLKKEMDKLSKLKKQKAGLMDDLLTGRVRVTELIEQQQQASSPEQGEAGWGRSGN